MVPLTNTTSQKNFRTDIKDIHMPKIKKIDHVALVVGDMDEALAFWQAI